MKKILITGGAGFIGSSLVDSLIKDPKIKITCLDSFDSFYDAAIKKNNISLHLKHLNYKLIEADICDIDQLKTQLTDNYDAIIHLAAKVGVKPSLHDPLTYTKVNVCGTQNMLEIAKNLKCKKFIFASSSSVYGINQNTPWSEDDRALLPISPYASTKISGELLGHAYSHLYEIQFLALRLFTVYGPRQRPDLVIHKFAKLILDNKPITVYGDGGAMRDYTFIDDITAGFLAALDYSGSQYEVINLGNNKPVKLKELIVLLEKALGKKADMKKIQEQSGDLSITFADISKAQRLFGYEPKTDLMVGLKKFVDWFRTKKS